jgi:hypothetical protein
MAMKNQTPRLFSSQNALPLTILGAALACVPALIGAPGLSALLFDLGAAFWALVILVTLLKRVGQTATSLQGAVWTSIFYTEVLLFMLPYVAGIVGDIFGQHCTAFAGQVSCTAVAGLGVIVLGFGQVVILPVLFIVYITYWSRKMRSGQGKNTLK